MRVDFSNQQSRTDELQQYLRLARIARGTMGAVIISAIGFLIAATLPHGDAELGVRDASVNEMQLYAVPPEQGVRDVEPPPVASSSTRTSDDELRDVTGVIHHG